jgi:hypothetical protein
MAYVDVHMHVYLKGWKNISLSSNFFIYCQEHFECGSVLVKTINELITHFLPNHIIFKNIRYLVRLMAQSCL